MTVVNRKQAHQATAASHAQFCLQVQVCVPACWLYALVQEEASADGVQADEVTADEDAPLQEEEAEETLDLAASAQEVERHTEEQPQVVVGRPFLVGTASVMSESESGGSDWVEAEQLQKGSTQQGV